MGKKKSKGAKMRDLILIACIIGFTAGMANLHVWTQDMQEAEAKQEKREIAKDLLATLRKSEGSNIPPPGSVKFADGTSCTVVHTTWDKALTIWMDREGAITAVKVAM